MRKLKSCCSSQLRLWSRTSSFTEDSLPVNSLTLHPRAMFHFQTSHSSTPPSVRPRGCDLSSDCRRVVLFGLSSLSVSSFVKKTTEKINTLQMNSELRQKAESREGGQADSAAPPLEDMDSE